LNLLHSFCCLVSTCAYVLTRDQSWQVFDVVYCCWRTGIDDIFYFSSCNLYVVVIFAELVYTLLCLKNVLKLAVSCCKQVKFVAVLLVVNFQRRIIDSDIVLVSVINLRNLSAQLWILTFTLLSKFLRLFWVTVCWIGKTWWVINIIDF